MKYLFSFSWTLANPLDTFQAIHYEPYSLFFDSNDKNHRNSRYSFICWHPVEMIESKNKKVTITTAERQFSSEDNIFDIIQDRLNENNFDYHDHQNIVHPFFGGAAGFFGYNLGLHLENLETPKETKNNPDLCIGIYDQVIAFDHESNNNILYIWAETKEKAEVKRRFIEKTTERSLRLGSQVRKQPLISFSPETPEDQYKKDIQDVIDYIYAGDIFQANLSQRFSANLPSNFLPFEHYKTLRTTNSSPFASYMNFGNVKIASASPERFLTVQNRQVEARPIKGTIPHIQDDPEEDKKSKAKLQQSEKDHAENIIIVDLLRNDLSKSCEDNSIDVTELCALETFAGVHHLVSTIHGKLRADKTTLDLLKSCFPGGSITGAPKVRAMEIISELEKNSRGPYCGSLGYIGFNGDMDTNIMIRTLVYQDQHVSFNVGGGITASSSPEGEYQETLDKAAKILESFSPTKNLKAVA